MTIQERKTELVKRLAKARRDRSLVISDLLGLDAAICRDERELRIVAIAEKALGSMEPLTTMHRVFPMYPTAFGNQAPATNDGL